MPSIRIVITVPFGGGFFKGLVISLLKRKIMSTLKEAIESEAGSNPDVQDVVVHVSELKIGFRVTIQVSPKSQWKLRIGRLLGVLQKKMDDILKNVLSALNNGLASKLDGYFKDAYGFVEIVD